MVTSTSATTRTANGRTADPSVRSDSTTGRPRRTTTRRERAPQGEGDRLRAEIVAAATALLIETGNPDKVTLRAVARAVGIAAPSIYLHFADRDTLLSALMDDAERRFAAALEKADPGPASTGVERLRRIALGYLWFAHRNGGAYQVLFNGLMPLPDKYAHIRTVEAMPASFAVLYRATVHACNEAVSNADPMELSLTFWAAVHGFVTLRTNLPGFPWPSASDFIEGPLAALLP